MRSTRFESLSVWKKARYGWLGSYASMKHAETLEQFLRRAADSLFPDETRAPNPLTVHSKSSDGDTPLHIAALMGDRHAARTLLANGAVIDAKGDMSATPLYYAVMQGHVLVAGLLLRSERNGVRSANQSRIASLWNHVHSICAKCLTPGPQPARSAAATTACTARFS